MPNPKSDFEYLVDELGLSPEQCVASDVLRDWARKNKDSRYVPPELLAAWGFTTEPHWSNRAKRYRP